MAGRPAARRVPCARSPAPGGPAVGAGPGGALALQIVPNRKTSRRLSPIGPLAARISSGGTGTKRKRAPVRNRTTCQLPPNSSPSRPSWDLAGEGEPPVACTGLRPVIRIRIAHPEGRSERVGRTRARATRADTYTRPNKKRVTAVMQGYELCAFLEQIRPYCTHKSRSECCWRVRLLAAPTEGMAAGAGRAGRGWAGVARARPRRRPDSRQPASGLDCLVPRLTAVRGETSRNLISGGPAGPAG